MSGEGGLTDLRSRLAALEAGGGGAAGVASFNGRTGTVTLLSGDVTGALGFTPLSAVAWGDISGQPSAFAPSAHTHAIADVTGLQVALDGKQAAGSYAAASHTHAIADVTGLQTALNGKQPSGSYAAASHSHVIGDVTGLQSALDGKEVAGAVAAHAAAGDPHPQYLTQSEASLLYAAIGAGGSDPWTWAKLALDVSNSTVTPAATLLTFTGTALTTYLVELVGTFTSAAITTGIAVSLDIPSGSVAGQAWHPISATTGNSVEQIADNATTGATTGVRAAATNVPILGTWIVAIGATGGAVTLNFRSEVAASAVTLKGGLTVLGRRVI